MNSSPKNTTIGLFYSTPCAHAPGSFMADASGFVPVLMPAHSDPDLGADYAHYHIDYRFVDNAAFNGICYLSMKERGGAVIQADSPVTMKRRKAKREPIVFPKLKYSTKWPEMERRHANCSIDLKNPVCPHRGICLKDAPIVDGVIICPGHGLGWDATTGANVQRHQGGDEYFEARADYNLYCELAREAQNLCNELDFHEGIALLDGNAKAIAKFPRIKKLASARQQRRSELAQSAYSMLHDLRSQLSE